MMKISYILTVRNFSIDKYRYYTSLENSSSELIIVSNSITDHTKYPKYNIYYYKFNNNYSAMKNFGLSKASGEWVFVIDSDEILSISLKENIFNLINTNTTEGYWVRRKTFISDSKYLKYGLFYPDLQLRLFRNRPEYRYFGAVHEEVSIPHDKTIVTKYDLIHYPRNPKYSSFKNYRNLIPYSIIQSKYLSKQYSAFILLILGISKFINIFFSGFIRGFGFLDGYAGFRAHLLFSWSIFYAYYLASKLRK